MSLKKRLRDKLRIKSARSIIMFTLVLSILEMCMILLGTYFFYESYNNLKKAEGKRIVYQQLADELMTASDDLSTDVRYFAITGNIEFFSNYWYEVNVDRTRDRIIEIIEKDAYLKQENKLLIDAKKYSDELMKIEMESMWYTLQAYGITKDHYTQLEMVPFWIENIYYYKEHGYEKVQNLENLTLDRLQKEISKEGINIYIKREYTNIQEQRQKEKFMELGAVTLVKDKKMKEKGIEILFDHSYYEKKNEIITNVGVFREKINAYTEKKVIKAEESANKAIFIQVFFTFCEIVVLYFILMCIQKMFIRPIEEYTKNIENINIVKKPIVNLCGTIEIKKFGKAINLMSECLWKELDFHKETEEKMRIAKEEAVNSNLAKSDFLRRMSHEIRTPLHGINGNIYLLQHTKLSKIQKEYVENIDVSTKMLLEEINEILDFSKIEAGKMKIHRINFSIKQLIEQLKAILENTAHMKGLEFLVYLDSNIPEYLVGDSLRLKQILTNLIYNGIKFTEIGCVVLHVTMKKEIVWDNKDKKEDRERCINLGNYNNGLIHSKTENVNNKYDGCTLEFSVEDTGIGISDEVKKVIFNDYFQSDKSISSNYSGTGLGLPICKRLVEMESKGKYTINIDSQEGIGSKFSFMMDFKYGEKIIKKKKKRLVTGIKNNMSILLVDDNDINLKMEKEIFGKLGFQADVENDPKKVLGHMKNKFYDLVFLDISMPEINGYELSRKIREHKEWDEVVLIALSANIGHEIQEEAKKSGMNDYLPKPFLVEDLEELLYKYKKKDPSTMKNNLFDRWQYKEMKSDNGVSQRMQAKENVSKLGRDDIYVDFKKVLEIFGNNEEKMHHLFQIFLEDNFEFIKKLKSYNKNNDVQAIREELHRMEGVTGNLMCLKLHNCIKDYHQKIKTGKSCQEELENLEKIFLTTVEEIEKMMQ